MRHSPHECEKARAEVRNEYEARIYQSGSYDPQNQSG